MPAASRAAALMFFPRRRRRGTPPASAGREAGAPKDSRSRCKRVDVVERLTEVQLIAVLLDVAKVRRADDVLHREQRIVDRGFFLVHIDGRKSRTSRA